MGKKENKKLMQKAQKRKYLKWKQRGGAADSLIGRFSSELSRYSENSGGLWGVEEVEQTLDW